MRELLSAALEGAHLKVTYDSIESGVTERVIFPHGLYASQGYWYCACFDRRRAMNVPMRADRFLSVERVEGFEPPQELSVQDWMNTAREASSERLRVQARVTERGRKSFELTSLFGRIMPEEDGVIEVKIPRSEIDYYASRLLSVGTSSWTPRRSWSRPSKIRPVRSYISTGPKAHSTRTGRGPAREKTIASRRSP